MKYTITDQEKISITSRFPHNYVKLSYETVAPKKVLFSEYDVCVAIPYGKKAYIWYTYFSNQNVCFLFELNRENKMGEFISIISTNIPKDFELGTILSGILYEPEITEINTNSTTFRVFLMDDIHFYKGVCLQGYSFQNKSGFFKNVLIQTQTFPLETIQLATPVFWKNIQDYCEKQNNLLPIHISVPYTVRYIQYRSNHYILPHFNTTIQNKPIWTPILSISRVFPTTSSSTEMIDWKIDIQKPIFRKNIFFWVSADIPFDLYKLYVKDNNNTPILFQNALIHNYKTSIFMNGIFRKIRENSDIDFIEESDDEEDFEDIREDKFVDLEKKIIMECTFHSKFRKWIPISIISDNSENVQKIPRIDDFIYTKQLSSIPKPSFVNKKHYTHNPSYPNKKNIYKEYNSKK